MLFRSADLKGVGVLANFSDDVDEIAERVRLEAREGDVTLILSNGAFGGVYGRIRELFR